MQHTENLMHERQMIQLTYPLKMKVIPITQQISMQQTRQTEISNGGKSFLRKFGWNSFSRKIVRLFLRLQDYDPTSLTKGMLTCFRNLDLLADSLFDCFLLCRLSSRSSWEAKIGCHRRKRIISRRQKRFHAWKGNSTSFQHPPFDTAELTF